MAVHVHADPAKLVEAVTVFRPNGSLKPVDTEDWEDEDTRPTAIPCTDWLEDFDDPVDLHLCATDVEEVVAALKLDPEAPSYPVVPMIRPTPPASEPIEFFAAGMLVATCLWSLVRALV